MLYLTRRELRFIGALLLTATSAFSQETRGGIFGHVSDPTGSAVSGAQVVVLNTSTNVSTALKSDDAGYYEAPLLVAGSYRVTAESPGFKKTERSSFELPVGVRLEVNFKLEVGAVSDTVTVSGEAPLINGDSLTSGVVVDSKSVLNLPWPGGNSVVLAMLTVGIRTRILSPIIRFACTAAAPACAPSHTAEWAATSIRWTAHRLTATTVPTPLIPPLS